MHFLVSCFLYWAHPRKWFGTKLGHLKYFGTTCKIIEIETDVERVCGCSKGDLCASLPPFIGVNKYIWVNIGVYVGLHMGVYIGVYKGVYIVVYIGVYTGVSV